MIGRVMAIVKTTKERRFWKTEEIDFPARLSNSLNQV
jgi:hypothetical protein